MKRYMLTPCYGPEDAGSGGGTTENIAGSQGDGASTGATSSGNITSGTASEAMVKAAMAASSAEEAATAEGAKPGGPGPTADATGQPPVGAKKLDTPAGDPNAAKPQGPVPLDRHEAAVKNARAEGVTETRTKYENAFGWIRGFANPGEKPAQVRSRVEAAVSLAQEVARVGPEAYVRQLAQELGIALAGSGQGNTGGGVTGDEAYPEADLGTRDGKKAYSDTAVLRMMEVQAAKLRREFQQGMKPFEDARKTQEQREQDAAHAEQVRGITTETMANFRKQLHWTKEAEPIIAGLVQQMDPAHIERIGAVAAFWEAFNQYKAERVYPTLGQTAEQKVRADNARKAAASVGAHPVSSGSEGKKKPLRDGDVGGLAARMAEMAEAGVG